MAFVVVLMMVAGTAAIAYGAFKSGDVRSDREVVNTMLVIGIGILCIAVALIASLFA